MNCSRKENSNLRVTHTREEREVPLTLVRSTPQKADLGTREQKASVSPHQLLLEDQSNATSHTRKPLVPPWPLPTAPCCSEWPPTHSCQLHVALSNPTVSQASWIQDPPSSYPESPAVRYHLQQDQSPEELKVSFTWKRLRSQEGVIPGQEGGQSCHDYVSGMSKGWAVYSP